MATVKGGTKLEAALAKIAARLSSGGTLRVGFLENATYPDGTSVAMIAAVQNFGAPNNRMFGGPPAPIPARPFFSNMVARKSGGWPKAISTLLVANHYDADRTLQLMGIGIKDQLQQSIHETNSPPLSRVTLSRRGVNPDMKYNPKDPATFGAKPLIHTAVMLNAVDFEIAK